MTFGLEEHVFVTKLAFLYFCDANFNSKPSLFFCDRQLIIHQLCRAFIKISIRIIGSGTLKRQPFSTGIYK